jgi:fukutin
MNKSTALNNLIDLSNILEKFQVKFWIQDGTLLGYYRHNDFISHDTDTDLGIDFSSFNPKCLLEILNMGFSIKHIFGYIEDSLEIALERNGVKTDLFFHYIIGNNQYHCAFLNDIIRIDYIYKKFNTKQIEFLNHKFPAPENELDYIKTKYGDCWIIPDKKWHWAYSPRNHKKTDIIIDKNISIQKFNKWINNQHGI